MGTFVYFFRLRIRPFALLDTVKGNKVIMMLYYCNNDNINSLLRVALFVRSCVHLCAFKLPA